MRISERKKHSEKKFIVLIAGKWEMLLYPKQNILINVKGGTLIKGLSSVVPEAGRARQEAGRCSTPLL